jgi:hypothetical protein
VARSKGPGGHTRHQIGVRHRRHGVAYHGLAIIVHLCERDRQPPCQQAKTGSGVAIVVQAPWKR